MKLQTVLAAVFALAALVGCVTNDQASAPLDPKTETIDEEGAFKIAPVGLVSRGELAADAAAATTGETVTIDAPVAEIAPDCSFKVIDKSAAAVGQPCLTSREFMQQLGLTTQQIARVERGSTVAKRAPTKKKKKSAH